MTYLIGGIIGAVLTLVCVVYFIWQLIKACINQL